MQSNMAILKLYKKITKKPIFNFLDNAVARIAKSLKVGGSGAAVTKPLSNAAVLFGEPKTTTVATTTTTTTTTITTETIKTKVNTTADIPPVSNEVVGNTENNVPVGNSEELTKPISEEPKDVTPEDDDENGLR